MGLNDDLRAAIDKNLSAETAGVLRTRLDSIDALEQQNAALVKAKAIADQNEARRVEAALAQAAKVAELEKALAVFQAREEILAGAERNILIANMQREKADAVVDAMRSVVGQVFANTLVKRSIFTNATEPVYVPPTAGNSYGNVTSASRSESKTVTEEG